MVTLGIERRQHHPHFRDRGDVKRDLPGSRRARCGRSAIAAPRRSATSTSRIGSAGARERPASFETIGAKRDRIAGRARAAQTPTMPAATIAGEADLGDPFESVWHVRALQQQPGAGEQDDADRCRVERVLDRDRRDAGDRRDARAHHQDLGRLAGEQPERRQVTDRIAGHPGAKGIAKPQLPIVGARHPRACPADHAKCAQQQDDREPPADLATPSTIDVQPPTRCTVKTSSAIPTMATRMLRGERRGRDTAG